MNGQATPYKHLNGLAVIMTSFSREEKGITPPCDPLLINGSEFCFAVGRIAFLMWKTFTSAPSRTSRGCPIDAVSSCASAVEKSGWLFENFSRLILTQPLGCLTDVLLGAGGVSSVIRAGLHGAQPPRPAESALREYERLRIPPNWGSRPQVVAALWRGLKNKRSVA